jgi:hypothetical protein
MEHVNQTATAASTLRNRRLCDAAKELTMISKAQFESITMTAPTRRTAQAEMDAALEAIDLWSALSALVITWFRSVDGASQPLVTRA